MTISFHYISPRFKDIYPSKPILTIHPMEIPFSPKEYFDPLNLNLVNAKNVIDGKDWIDDPMLQIFRRDY